MYEMSFVNCILTEGHRVTWNLAPLLANFAGVTLNSLKGIQVQVYVPSDFFHFVPDNSYFYIIVIKQINNEF